jgi:uncharacterized repeat protein (TIGR01451 family)
MSQRSAGAKPRHKGAGPDSHAPDIEDSSAKSAKVAAPLLLLGILLLLGVGVAFRLGLLVYAMYAMLGVLLISRFLAREWIENISADRRCNRATAQVGEKVAVVVTVRNAGRFTAAWLLVEDSLPREALLQRPPRIQVDGRRTKLLKLKSGSEASLMYQVTFLMRGYYQFGPLLVESGDLFGLHRRYRVLTEPHFVMVYPKVLPLEGYNFASRRPIGEVRLTHRLFEDPTRISGVRQYQNGDALNRIHWRATARTGVLHSKIYEPSTVAGATILLDFHRDSYSARGEPHRSELAVTAAASLANTVYQLGEQIGLVTNGRDAADRIRLEGYRHDFRTRAAAHENLGMTTESDRLQPQRVDTRRGAEQLMRILELLARVELTDGMTLPQLISETSNRLPRDATVIAILPRVTPEDAIALGNLRRGGYAVSAIVLLLEQMELREALGRLLAQGIDARGVDDEAGISAVCSRQLV